ncbi:MAG TPA: LLM class F420-dependent oxidoreductase [Acidimicrobiales bacterium]|nr:LLM class F420-dependent oxidoreductase [Acidimicrobiales bacterium]
MDLSLHLANFKWPGGTQSIAPTLAATAAAAEESGVAEITFMDHWFQMDRVAPAEDPMMEGYTSLGYMAGLTRTMTLSLLVTGVTYRYPGLLAKTVTTLDVLSGGRAQLGIGAAWYEREHRALGVPFPPVAERFERLEEALQICLQMWSDNDGPYHGRHYQLEATLCSPRPISQPRPPILIGGSGERKTLRLVAKYADACNLFGSSVDDVRHKLDVLRRHCDTEGRDFATITPTILAFGNPVDDPDGFIAQMADYAKLGVKLVGIMPFGDPVEMASGLGSRVIPALKEL